MFAILVKHRMSAFLIGYMTLFLLFAIMGVYFAGKSKLIANPIASHVSMNQLGYYDLPRMTISAGGGNGGGGATAPRIRLDLSLEVAGKDMEILKGYQPRIMDRLTRFLADLRPDQLSHESMPWLREQILEQINHTGAPVSVHDVMFRELVVM